MPRAGPSVETLGYSRKSLPGLGQDELLELKPSLRAGMFIREEKDQAAPSLRELVQEQPALAARLGGEHRRIAPHLRAPGGEQSAMPQPHRQRRDVGLDSSIRVVLTSPSMEQMLR